MYTVSVKREFDAHHFLVGGDWGDENRKHAHHYEVTARLEGLELDLHGYLADIADIEKRLDTLVGHFRGKTLNELPEFSGLNPSIEHFSRVFCDAFSKGLEHTIEAVTVIIAENSNACASFRRDLRENGPGIVREP